jgi:hypothetical protein
MVNEALSKHLEAELSETLTNDDRNKSGISVQNAAANIPYPHVYDILLGKYNVRGRSFRFE